MVRLCPNLASYLDAVMLLWYKQNIEIVECFSISGRMVEDRRQPVVITLCSVCRACEESCLDFRASCNTYKYYKILSSSH